MQENQDFDLYEGQHKVAYFTLADYTAVGELTACTFKMAKDGRSVGKTLMDGITLSEVDGAVQAAVTLLPEDTDGYPGVYAYQLWETDTTPDPLAGGTIRVKESVL